MGMCRVIYAVRVGKFIVDRFPGDLFICAGEIHGAILVGISG